jgi:hypothetical protein
MLRLKATLVTKDGSRSREPLITAVKEFDAGFTRVYSERLAEGEEAAEKWLAEHAEAILLEKCSVLFVLEQSPQ